MRPGLLQQVQGEAAVEGVGALKDPTWSPDGRQIAVVVTSGPVLTVPGSTATWSMVMAISWAGTDCTMSGRSTVTVRFSGTALARSEPESGSE